VAMTDVSGSRRRGASPERYPHRAATYVPSFTCQGQYQPKGPGVDAHHKTRNRPPGLRRSQ
jgi:hypothetical protein